MPNRIGKFKIQPVSLILVFGLVMSSLGYGSAWGQETLQNNIPQSTQNANKTAFDVNPCFSQYGNQPRMNHFGAFGNQTARTSHFAQFGNHTRMNHFGSLGNQTARSNHFGQYINQTNYKLNPCFNQNGNQTSFRNNQTNQAGMTALGNSSPKYQIPIWVKNNAKWWAQNQLNDTDFVSGIQYLIQQGVMKIPQTTLASSSSLHQIPSWIKSNAGWWASGQISDDDFVKGIQYLISNGIMKIA